MDGDGGDDDDERIKEWRELRVCVRRMREREWMDS